ncbi:hypothetical protein P2G88_00975 [Aliiglaciecola sp. CAU 1673]|uniref:hypothetical protein n=1 Tax=Aliiglaciecola sp. CAU 1673 TaxID=3032595 RepID=UPI0023DAF282|nr:hypothetical protein [Aliiglaciecola sp. CAU 1673]MDF2176822.1 hypothetical protein [Aliiglaciecola sp. CAU 1673]
MNAFSTLRLVKSLHTLIWALFAGAIIAIPFLALAENFTLAWVLIVFVLLEVLLLVANRMRCPLTEIAARYTDERQDNFDIYLPLWLARYNKHIFGGLFIIGLLLTCWLSMSS